MVDYNPEQIESKWQKKWEEDKIFEVKKSDKEKYYVLEMYPYPRESNFKNLENRYIFNISDIDYEDILSSPSLESVREDIQLILNNYKIAAFNINFDMRFLESRGFIIPKKLKDLMLYTRSILPKDVRYNLQEAYKYLYHLEENESGKYLKDNNFVEQHRALDDVMYEAELLYFLFRKFNYPITFQKTLHLK